ncbi:MAG: hypothetical protein QOK58_06665, partial [Nitrososphaeraceae archaeon]|nr:hypothetical protein [Nitrososphaeraceae archaeon]
FNMIYTFDSKVRKNSEESYLYLFMNNITKLPTHTQSENLICNPCSGSKEYSYLSSLPKGISATSSL